LLKSFKIFQFAWSFNVIYKCMNDFETVYTQVCGSSKGHLISMFNNQTVGSSWYNSRLCISERVSKGKYTNNLDADVQRQTAIIGGHYSYSPTGTMWIIDPVNFPSVMYIDMMNNYFILGQSPFYTIKDLRNYRSLDLLLSLYISVLIRKTHYAGASAQKKATCSHKHQE